MEIKTGIDIGSVATKCVIVKDKEIISQALIKTGVDAEKSAEHAFAKALSGINMPESGISSIVSTGYGRRLFKRANKIITEISAVANGVSLLASRENCLIIDVGGQDTKLVEINGRGEVIDFLMNDKCAAGTGRFLEMMAGVLETELDVFSELALKSKSPVCINSTCSVFAESEVVSLLAQAVRKEDIAAGLINAIAVRIASMVGRFGHCNSTVFCGGAAQNRALEKALKEAVGRPLIVLENPQFVAAFGAALA